MKRILNNSPFLILSGICIVSISLYVDWGSESFEWFQRSGSLLVMVGAILGYRSVIRLGKRGVGGAPDGGRIGKVKESYIKDGRQMVKVEYSPEQIAYDRQLNLDKFAGYVGAIYAILGTIIWGYGDLLGRI